jgi:DNA polymerase zeta
MNFQQPLNLVSYLIFSDIEVNSYVHQLATSLDRAMDLACNTKSQQYVFKISPVRGKPYYGYDSNDKIFLKIFVFNPQVVSKMAAVLRSGAILGTAFQPHEVESLEMINI